MTLNAHRGEIVDLLGDPRGRPDALRHVPDGLLVIEDGHVRALGTYDELAATLPDDAHVTLHEGGLIAPGFVDCHVHYPQLDMMAAPGAKLMDWLERYTFPAEAAFADVAHADDVAARFVAALLAHGTTTALVFATVHAQSVDALFRAALAENMRLIGGKVLMDRNAPEALCEDAGTAWRESRDLMARWRGRGRLSYAITPRFAPSCSPELLTVAGRLLAESPEALLQTHLAENEDEIALVAQLFPEAEDYLDVYARHGLLTGRAVFAHCVHADDDMRRRLAAADAAIATCPTSNMFLGSGLFAYDAAREAGIRIGLGSDVGAGTTLSIPATAGAAYEAGHLRGSALDPLEAFHMMTLGGAAALRLDDRIGNFEPGKEADFLVLDRAATPLLAHRLAGCRDIAEVLFALTILGDDRIVRHTYVAGRLAYTRRAGV